MFATIAFFCVSLFVQLASSQVVVEYFFDNTTCATAYYGANTYFPNVCIPANPPFKYSSTVVQTSTVINVTATYYLPADTSCGGSAQSTGVQQLSKSCIYDSKNNYNHYYKYFATDPGTVTLGGSNGYSVTRYINLYFILIFILFYYISFFPNSIYDTSGCSTGLYRRDVYPTGCIASYDPVGMTHYGRYTSCNCKFQTLKNFFSNEYVIIYNFLY